jgi:hypothetical protein
VGVTVGVIVIVSVVVVAHCPAVGVKVYVVVTVLLIAGDQVPVMPFWELVGKAGIEAPTQYGPTAEKVGVIFGLTTMVIVVEFAQRPGLGVKV